MSQSNHLFNVESIELLEHIPDQSINLIYYAIPYGQASRHLAPEESEHVFREYSVLLEKHSGIVGVFYRRLGNLFMYMSRPVHTGYGQAYSMKGSLDLMLFRKSSVIPDQTMVRSRRPYPNICRYCTIENLGSQYVTNCVVLYLKTAPQAVYETRR